MESFDVTICTDSFTIYGIYASTRQSPPREAIQISLPAPVFVGQEIHHGIAIVEVGRLIGIVESVFFVLIPKMPGMARPFVEMRKGKSTVSAGITRVDLHCLLE